MRRIVLLLSLLSPCACRTIPPPALEIIPTIAYPFDTTTLVRDDVRACGERITALAGHGYLAHERAAFLVLSSDGTFDCSVWPPSNGWHSATWSGKIPNGTVAVIHTHPRTIPQPSSHDTREARRLDIPVIVVTPGSMAMTR